MDRFNLAHYVPVLRWKQAEQIALAQLYQQDSICITPLIELVPENFIRKDAKGHISKLSTAEVISRVGAHLYQSWGERPLFIDLWLLSPDLLDARSNNFFTMLGQYATTLGMSLIPVVGINRDCDYLSVAHTVIDAHNQGACLRLTGDDIKRPNLNKDVSALLALLRLPPERIDLMIDFQIVTQSIPDINVLCKLIPDIGKWRNFMISSGAFPKDLSKLRKNDVYRVDRTDWTLWRDQMVAKSSLIRIPNYSDYTIQHAKYLERKGRSRYSASIRYTSDDYWIIMRGEDVFKEDGPRFHQWPAQAVLLCDMPEYCKDTFSEGDKYIKEMSLQRKQTGTMATWLTAGINHHMTYTARQLATLCGSSTVAVS